MEDSTTPKEPQIDVNSFEQVSKVVHGTVSTAFLAKASEFIAENALIDNDDQAIDCANKIMELKTIKDAVGTVLKKPKASANSGHKKWTGLEKETAGKIQDAIDSIKRSLVRYLLKNQDNPEIFMCLEMSGVQAQDAIDYEIEDERALLRFLADGNYTSCVSFSKSGIKSLLKSRPSLPGVKKIDTYTLVAGGKSE